MMKPVLTFVLGAALASAIAVFLVKRTPEPVQPTAPPVVAESPAVEAPAAPLPVPVAPVTVTRSPAKSGKAARTVAKSAVTSETRTDSLKPVNEPHNTPESTPTPQAGPPQTTISMPPPPAETKPIAPPRVAKTVTIPAGTLLNVRVDEKLSSSTSQTGDSFRATLDGPLVVDGAVIAERGAKVEGRVAEADRGGKVKGTATLALELVRINTSDGQRVRLQTEGFTKSAEKSTKKDAMKVGVGAGLGAAIGAIAGGGKGAAIGAGVGGAAGTGAVMATRGEAAEIPAETRLTFRLREPITLTEKL
jgi:hypothetical protein